MKDLILYHAILVGGLTLFGLIVAWIGYKSKKKVSESEERNKEKILRYAGVLEMGGNAVEDERKLYRS